MGRGKPDTTTEVVHRLWRALGSNRLTAFLLAALLLASLLAGLFPQLPADPARQEAWLSAVQLRYGGATGLLQALGLLDAFHSPWYLALLAALLLNTLACTLQRLPGLWRHLTGPPAVARPPAFYQAASQRARWPVADWQAGQVIVGRCLRQLGYEIYVDKEAAAGVAHLYAERGRWTQAATLLSHVAVLLLVLAVAASRALAWQQDDLVLLPDQPQSVGPDGGLVVETGSLALDYHPGGQPRDYVIELKAQAPGSPGTRRTVGRNRPLTYRGTSFHLLGHGPAVHLQTANGDLYQAFAGEQSQEIVLPEADLRLRLSFRPEGAPFFVEALTGDGTRLGSGTVADGQEIEIQGLALSFTLIRYTRWQVSRDPTFGPALTAAGLLLAGMLISLWLPHRRLWLRLDDQGAQLAGRVGSDGHFKALAAELAAACQPEGDSHG